MLALPTKYALKALASLSRQPIEEFVQVKALSEHAGVPGPFLSKIMKRLVAKRILESRKGVGGGVRFAPQRGEVTFYDICVALEDPLVSQYCFLSKHLCQSSKPCILHSQWGGLKGEIIQLLQKTKVRG